MAKKAKWRSPLEPARLNRLQPRLNEPLERFAIVILSGAKDLAHQTAFQILR
jgi:hypothetical protein